MSNNQEQWRNKKTGTIYQSVEFLGNNLAEANTGKSIYLVKESNLERVEPMADTQEFLEYVLIAMTAEISNACDTEDFGQMIQEKSDSVLKAKEAILQHFQQEQERAMQALVKDLDNWTAEHDREHVEWTRDWLESLSKQKEGSK